MKNNWKEEYYNWQWTTKPSDDAGNFYPNRTNLEIAEWWIDKLAEQKKELKKKIEGKRKESEKFVPFQKIHYQSALDDIISELNHQ